MIREFGNGARQFHAGGAAADDHEGHQCGAPLRIGFAFGALQGQQYPTPDRGGVFQSLEARRIRFPFVVPEIGMPRTGGEHQCVVLEHAAVIERHPPPLGIDGAHGAEQGGDLLALAHQVANGPGNFRGRQRRGADLIQQRLKQMVIALIDDGDLDVCPGQSMGCPQTAEARADDDHVMRQFVATP